MLAQKFNVFSDCPPACLDGAVFHGLISRDEESRDSVRFHAENDDYFATLATVLGLLAETSGTVDKQRKTMNKLKDELMFLQKNYRIVKRRSR